MTNQVETSTCNVQMSPKTPRTVPDILRESRGECWGRVMSAPSCLALITRKRALADREGRKVSPSQIFSWDSSSGCQHGQYAISSSNCRALSLVLGQKKTGPCQGVGPCPPITSPLIRFLMRKMEMMVTLEAHVLTCLPRGRGRDH